MRKLELLLAGALALSPALFAQQSTSTNTQSTQAESSQKAGKSKLTVDQKAELKDLRARAKDACKADKKSESCKTAKQDLHAKMNEYGVKGHGHRHRKATTTSSAGTQSPS